MNLELNILNSWTFQWISYDFSMKFSRVLSTASFPTAFGAVIENDHGLSQVVSQESETLAPIAVDAVLKAGCWSAEMRRLYSLYSFIKAT